MAGLPRTEEELATLKAAARELRASGMRMQAVADKLGVPASTLYTWAAQGGWRGQDLAVARYRAALCFPGHEDLAETEPETGPEAKTDTEKEAAETMTPLQARQAAERALRSTAALMQAGELKAASDTMRLAERMLGAARLLADPAVPSASELAARDEEAQRESEERMDAFCTALEGLVHLALQGRVTELPAWACTKEFLADTLYPDMYYRPPRAGTGEPGHYGPGFYDDWTDEAQEG